MSFIEGVKVGSDIKYRRELLQADKEKRDIELQKAGYRYEGGQLFTVANSAADITEQRLALQAKSLQAMNAKLLQQDTDNAIVDYASTGDANLLDKALQSNPDLKQAWASRGVQTVGNIDFKNDTSILAKVGLEPTAYDTPEKEDILRKNLYKIHDGQGWNIGMLSDLATQTGALSRLGLRGQVVENNIQSLTDLLRGPKTSPYTAEGHKYEKEIIAAAEKTGVPANLIASIIHAESGGNPSAVSPKGATGVMQLMPDTAKEVGVIDPTNPAQSIEGGATYLAKMLNKYNGDIPKALAAYNAGPGNVDKYKGIPPFAETTNYVNKVMNGYSQGESKYDRTINTIASYFQQDANAAKGSSNAMEQQKLDNETAKISNEAAKIDALTGGRPTEKQRNLAAAEAKTQELYTAFGGEDSFYKTDFSKPENYRKGDAYANAIDELSGRRLSEADKKKLAESNKLLKLAEPGTRLTDSNTGILDSTFKQASTYLKDNVDGIAATSANAAFRNVLRNALYGATLTDGEISAFNEAYGSLGQKAGPALQMFKTGLLNVKADLETQMAMMSPTTFKIRFGKSAEEMDKIMSSLDNRISLITGVIDTGKPLAKTPTKSLDDIASEVMGSN